MKNVAKHNEWQDSKTFGTMFTGKTAEKFKYSPLQCRDVNLKLAFGKGKVKSKSIAR